MSVTVVSNGPTDPRKTTCRKCTYKLTYTGEDVKTRITSDYTGHKNVESYIACPQCGYHTQVKPWYL